MGDIIFGSIVILMYGSIIFKMIYNITHKGHACTCSHCPIDLINKEGKIDLLGKNEKEG